MLGAARYREDCLEWYRVFSLSLRPRVRLRRDETHVLRVRQPEPLEVGELYDDQVVAELGDAHAGLWVAMSRDDMTAFHSWTEAGPPGQHFSS